jgi:hypothetical protein
MQKVYAESREETDFSRRACLLLSFILNPLKNSTRDPSSNNVVHAAQSINRLLRLENQSMRDSTCPKDVSNAAPGQADHSQRFCFWNMGDAAPRVVLGIGPCRAGPAQAHRASCQTGSGQESPNNFWAVPCQPEV